MQAYFDQLDRVRYEGPRSTNPLAFRHYNPDEIVLGKRICLVSGRLIVRGSNRGMRWRWQNVKRTSRLSFSTSCTFRSTASMMSMFLRKARR